MGYAIIKTSTLNAYALNRKIQNVIPKDVKYRKLIPSNADFNYGSVSTEGICKLSNVDLKDGTQPYEYKLCSSAGVDLSNQQSRAGVRIDPISGVIVLSSDYDGQDVWVRLAPKTVTGYYDTSVITLYKKVISAGSWTPVIPDTHTAVLDSIVYNFGNNQNWNSNSITAAATQLTLSSVTITYDGESDTFSGEALNDFYNDVTNISIVGKVNNTKIVDWTETLRQFTISANPNSSERTIQFTITFKYKGEDVSWVHPNGLAQSGNVLNSVSNVTGPNELTVGTTLVASNYSATGTYSNGTTSTVYATGISPSTVSQGTNNYTLTFANNVTETISITGQSSSTKTWITGVPSEYYRGAGSPYPQNDPGTHEWPLYVTVSGYSDPMKYTDFLTLSNREEYSDPVITINTSKVYNDMVTRNPIVQGTLKYTFDSSDYIYDAERTSIDAIDIVCTSDSSKSVHITQYNDNTKYCITADRSDTTYFTENFDEVDISTVANVISGTGNGYIHLSSDYSVRSSQSAAFAQDGTVYKLNDESDYYIKATRSINKSNIFAIVSIDTTGKDASDLSSVFEISDQNNRVIYTDGDNYNVKIVYVDSGSRDIYIHHTPTSGRTTYIIDGSTDSTPAFTIKMLIPKT